jgi:F-box protein, helicase, 18
MQFSTQQKNIIQSTSNIKVNAVAGSGKTSTLLAYAKAKAPQKVLYLVFNKSIRTEVQQKIQQQGITNMVVETAHSLAYKNIVPQHNYTIVAGNYTASQLVQQLNITTTGQAYAAYAIANHVLQLVANFCNSTVQKVAQINYLETIENPEAHTFVLQHYTQILQLARIFLAQMNAGQIPITHDFYLKKYQLSQPVLNYPYILFDEGQDASPAMLAIFTNQPGVKVIVGDTHQQIYSWRYAVNALEQVNFTQLPLNTSYRCNNATAALAQQIIHFKNSIGGNQNFIFNGVGTNQQLTTTVTLARTNLGLLNAAINYITTQPKTKQIYFEGSLQTYTITEDGVSLYDVLNLYLGKPQQIRHQLIKSFTTFSQLENYVKQTEDIALGFMIDLVKEYEADIFDLLQQLQQRQVANNQRSGAAMVFSTVHRAKGLEFNVVHLTQDFITHKKLHAQLNNPEQPPNLTKLNEEVNLLYVAVTRTQHILYIPENILPPNFAPHSTIKIVATTNTGNTYLEKRQQQKLNPHFWSPKMNKTLTQFFYNGTAIAEIATYFSTTKGNVYKQLKQLKLVN